MIKAIGLVINKRLASNTIAIAANRTAEYLQSRIAAGVMLRKIASRRIPPPAPLIIVMIETPTGSNPRFTAISAPVIANRNTARRSYVTGS